MSPHSPDSTAPTDPMGWTRRVTALAARVTRSPIACLSCVDDEGQEVILAVHGESDDSDAIGTPIRGLLGLGDAGRTSGAIDHDHPLRAHPLFGDRWGVRSLLAVPILVAGRRCGTLSACAPEERAFVDDHLESLRLVAALAGTHIEDHAHGAPSELVERLRSAEAHIVTSDETLKLLEKVLSCVPGVVYQFELAPDGSSCFPYASEGMRVVFGFDPEEVDVDASPIWDRLHPDDVERVQASVLASAEQETEWRDRYRYLDEDGTIRWLQGEANPERRSDGSTLWHGYIHDITEAIEREHQLERARRKALEATKVKSAFLANVSHEIRTPLGAVLGYAEVLTESGGLGLTDDQAEAVTAIRSNAEHLLGLINDLLDVEKIEAGRLTVERIGTNPAELVADVIALLRVRAEAKGLALEPEFASPIPERIVTDPTRLRQILINLVGNAIKFTHEGSVTLRVRFVDAERPRLVFEVIDTGIGMSREQLATARRFEAFTQADTSTTRRFGGTGLGLRISSTLANELGDGLKIESSLGEGSTFRVAIDPGTLEGVDLVCVTARSGPVGGDKPARVGGDRPAPTGLLEGVRILLAEDAPDNQRLITHHLTKAGALVDLAENGRIAIERVIESLRRDDGAYDIVLMDMMMPEVDGYGATRALREQGYTSPIVAVTAHASESDRVTCMESGCDGYLSKPISGRTLIETCLQHVGLKRAA